MARDMVRSLAFRTPMGPPSLVTVAIPVRNGADVLAAQLEALRGQVCSVPWELVVVDNGSTDGTAALARSYDGVLPGLRVVHEPRRGIGPARNAALAAARGDLLAVCDADDTVQPGWIEAWVQAMPGHDQGGGYCDATLLSSPRAISWRGSVPADRLPPALETRAFAPGGNSAVWVGAAREVGGWDESYRAGSDDVDFSWRLQALGADTTFVPAAVIGYRYREGLRDLLKQFFRFGRTEVRLAKDHHAFVGVRRGGPRDVLAVWRHLLLRLPLRSLRADGVAWLREVAYRAGRLRGSVDQRYLFP